MPRDRAINAGPTSAWRQRRLTGHEQLRNKLPHRDVSSCRFFLYRKVLSPLHTVRTLNFYSCRRRCWEGVWLHIGSPWAAGVEREPPRGGVGWGGFLVYSGNIRNHVYYTTLSVRVLANINWCLEKWKVWEWILFRSKKLGLATRVPLRSAHFRLKNVFGRKICPGWKSELRRNIPLASTKLMHPTLRWSWIFTNPWTNADSQWNPVYNAFH